jgi:hypothetical protein
VHALGHSLSHHLWGAAAARAGGHHGQEDLGAQRGQLVQQHIAELAAHNLRLGKRVGAGLGGRALCKWLGLAGTQQGRRGVSIFQARQHSEMRRTTMLYLAATRAGSSTHQLVEVLFDQRRPRQLQEVHSLSPELARGARGLQHKGTGAG